MTEVTPVEIEARALSALIAHGALASNAVPVARAIARAEAEGNSVCGLFYLPIFCEQLRCGKVDGHAEPAVTVNQAVVSVDAKYGFAHPAIAAGMPLLIETARHHGIAAMSVGNSYNCLALGHHATPLADAGLIGICMSNAPASVAPPGSARKLFGTNPLAFAVPVEDGPPILVDQSMSAVTKTAMILRRNRGEAIPPGWAQDADGNPTLDPAAGLEGSLLPAGGQKGANIALLVEILAAALSGSTLSTAASSFGGTDGGPPAVGQFMLAIDPAFFGNGALAASVAAIAAAYGNAGVRLPGQSRRRRDSVDVDDLLWQKTLVLAGG